MATGVYPHKKGYKRPPCSEETRRKISEGVRKFVNKNPGVIGFQKGHPSFWKHETKKMVSERLKAMGHKPPIRIGANHGNWKGGGLAYAKKKAKERDNYTCQECGFREDAIMQVDHIKPKKLFPSLIKLLENLATLCPNCHARKTIKEINSRIWKTGRPKRLALPSIADIG